MGGAPVDHRDAGERVRELQRWMTGLALSGRIQARCARARVRAARRAERHRSLRARSCAQLKEEAIQPVRNEKARRCLSCWPRRVSS
jgi:hypothetical protein